MTKTNGVRHNVISRINFGEIMDDHASMFDNLMALKKLKIILF
jgi:hypothetical protein